MLNLPTYGATDASPRSTVLVADSAASDRNAYAAWLEAAGHTVIAVGSGNEAIRAARHRRIDFVITEIIMADGDGLELLGHLNSLRVRPRVLAVSAGGRYLPAADCLHVAKRLGADAVLLKPVTREVLVAAVQHLDRAVGNPSRGSET